MSKKGKAKQLKSPQSHPPEVLSDIPDSAVNNQGVTAAVHQFLEVRCPDGPCFGAVLTRYFTDCRSHGPDEPFVQLLLLES